MTNDELVFFSVPYEKDAWTATVNGEPVPVEKVSVGFIAVRVPAGDCEIRVNYETPGLKLGASVSAVSLAAILVYLGVNCWLDRRRVSAGVPSSGAEGSDEAASGAAVPSGEDTPENEQTVENDAAGSSGREAAPTAEDADEPGSGRTGKEE